MEGFVSYEAEVKELLLLLLSGTELASLDILQ